MDARDESAGKRTARNEHHAKRAPSQREPELTKRPWPRERRAAQRRKAHRRSGAGLTFGTRAGAAGGARSGRPRRADDPMRPHRLSWPARCLVAFAALLALAIGVLLGWSAFEDGAAARLLLAANGSLLRGLAVAGAVGVGAAVLVATLMRRTRHGRARLGIALALFVAAGGAASAVRWAQGMETEAIAFASDGVALQGTLMRPAGDGRFPTVVIVHGSPRLARAFYAVWGRALVRRGVAVFVYDKRGTGASGGVVPDDNGDAAYLRLLGADAARAVEAVADRPHVDAGRLGLLGLSQGGWTVPVAASITPKVARIALLSGPVATVAEENAYSVAAEGRNGDAEADRRAIAAGDAAAAKAAGGFDPQPILATLPMDGLWLYGGRDRSIPVRASVQRLEALAASGHRYRVEVLPHADHVLFDRRRWVPAFEATVFDRLAAWFVAPVEARRERQ
jgi:dienelactone hydrolase